jgi:hypothetical protein
VDKSPDLGSFEPCASDLHGASEVSPVEAEPSLSMSRGLDVWKAWCGKRQRPLSRDKG